MAGATNTPGVLPPGICEDVWTAASELAWRELGTRYRGDIEVIARAVQAERNRCHSLAMRERRRHPGDNDPALSAVTIALAIVEGETP